MYSLRVYHKNGSFDHEEFFETVTQMDERYEELCANKQSSLSPTAWNRIGTEWCRLAGY